MLAHDRSPVDDPRELRQQLADLDSRRDGVDRLEDAALGDIGLEVERIGMGRSAVHPQHHHPLRAGFGAGFTSAARAANAGSPIRHPRLRAKRIVVLWMDGGPPHTERSTSSRMCPSAASSSRSIRSRPASRSPSCCRFARMVDRAAIVRSMSTIENEHLGPGPFANWFSRCSGRRQLAEPPLDLFAGNRLPPPTCRVMWRGPSGAT